MAGHESRPNGRSCDSGDIEAFEDGSIGREAIKIGCIGIGVAVDLEVAVAEIVGKDEYNILGGSVRGLQSTERGRVVISRP